MSARMNPFKLAPDGYKGMLALAATSSDRLEPALVELVKTRASQINGCAFCLNMHMRDALKAGETPQRLTLLNAWQETSLYSPREQAALALTEAMTRLADAGVSDDVYARVQAQFDDTEIAQLIFVIVAINAWNRIQVAVHAALD